jgi:arylsulfatase A-like enzyme
MENPEMRDNTTITALAFIFLLARVAGAGDSPVATSAALRPNIVFILADDLGWRDTSLYGSTFHHTPNIDRLAQRGIRFMNAYAANPLCSPTRASILTGLYPGRIGITTPSCHLPEVRLEAGLPKRTRPDEKAVTPISVTRLKTTYPTLAKTLKEAGYATGHFGKWHLGHEPYSALQHGFDVDVPHYPGPGPAGSYLAPWKFPPALKFTGQKGEHIEDRMAQEAVKFLRANKDRPFYLNYWAFSVHAPWDAKPELVGKYKEKADPKAAQRNPVYAAMVQSLDDGVGTLLNTLDELKIADRTIVIFFSDNGGVHWLDDRMKQAFGLDSPPTSNAPLRGGKAALYEGGTREPCIVVWPGRVKPDSTTDALLSSVDFYPTLLEMVGMKSKEGQKLDGVSQVPAILGTGAPRDTAYCFFPHYVAATGNLPGVWVRKGDWKLIRFFCDNANQTDRYELYDLRSDIGETKNLADRMPEKVAELNALIERHLKDIAPLLPKPNPTYRRAATRARDRNPAAG